MDNLGVVHVHFGYDDEPDQVRIFGEDRDGVKEFVKQLRDLVNLYHKVRLFLVGNVKMSLRHYVIIQIQSIVL